MNLKRLCLVVAVVLPLAVGHPVSAQTREQLVEQVKRTLSDIHRVQQAYHLEWDRYTESLSALGLDPKTLPHQDYWDLHIMVAGTGFVAEARGIKAPTLGEVWRVDQSGAVIQAR